MTTVVRLNVGGREFDTLESTIRSRGPNRLTQMVRQRPIMLDGRVFIDRNGNVIN